MNYSRLAQLLNELDSTTKRLAMTTILADFLKSVEINELDKIILLLKGTVFPEWSSEVLGIADKLMIKALSKASGRTEDEVIKEWKNKGDLGLVAENFMKDRKQTTLNNEELSITKVFNNLVMITKAEGKGSVERKIALISELLTNSTPIESRYITRTILGTLRVGIGTGTIRDSLSEAFNCDKKLIDNAYNLTSDYSRIAITCAKEGNQGLERIELMTGTPVKSMLYQKASSIKEGFEIVGKPASIEYKYDGLRLQAHKKGSEVRLFTRRLEDVSEMFPEITQAVKDHIKGDCIIEGEGVGYDPKTLTYKPFQELSKRIKRKYEINESANQTPAVIYLFDLLEKEGKDYLNKTYKERRDALKEIITEKKWSIELAKTLITDSEKETEKFYNEALRNNQEGVMMKNLSAPYQPGSRVGYGIKIKPIMETLDLAIISAEWGTGKRSKWLSSFTLACKKNDEYFEIGKLGTGLSEEQFNEVTEKLKPLIIKEQGKEVMVKPKILLEVGYEEIQKSPTYSSGYALRFPRLIRFRPDKDEPDNLDKVERIYKEQAKTI